MSISVTMTSAEQAESDADKPPFPDMVWILGGTFLMGSDKHYPEEAPAHEVTVEGFWMDRHTVTNEEFRKFVEEGAFASLASWRENRSEDYLPQRRKGRQVRRNQGRGREEKWLGRGALRA
jgi:formylglycine-generating enzyme required for sulfatase activity